MKLTTGVDEVYYKEFVLDEAGIKDFNKMLENAAQRFPEPAEMVYTIGLDDFRYFQTNRFDDVLHDPDVQNKRMVYLAMEAIFADQNPRLNENILHEGRSDEWRIKVAFQIVQKGSWTTRRDKISLIISSEDRKWAGDYIDRFEELIYKMKRAHQAPALVFWLFLFPLIIMGRSLYLNFAHIQNLLATGADIFFFSAAALSSLIMAWFGMASNLFGYRPYIIRFFFGPDTGFQWGEAGAEYEEREKFRQRVFLYTIVEFVIILIVSMYFAMK